MATNKYPIYKIIKMKKIVTDEGDFAMTIYKEKCGKSFEIKFSQQTCIVYGKSFEFKSADNIEVFKMVDNKFVHDPYNKINSSFIQEIQKRKFNFAFTTNYIKLKYYINECIDGVLSETEDNDIGIRK
jgi:hypothetical protein